MKSNIKVQAKLKNFQIWIPLQAQQINSQIMNLSFMSDFEYIKALDLTGATSFDLVKFNLTHFLISMVSLSSDTTAQSLSHTLTSTLIDPCCLSLDVTSHSKEDGRFKESKVSLALEPLYLRIGFLHIDFANVVMAEITQTLAYVKELQENNKRSNGIT
jgi:hypothetical protein